MRPLPEGWIRVWVWGWQKVVAVRGFAFFELCIRRTEFDGAYEIFHRRTGWTIKHGLTEAEAVEMAESWSSYDWDFEAVNEDRANATRARVAEWLIARAA